MRKKLTLALAAVMLLSALPLSSCGSKKSITVYATSEDYRIENAKNMFALLGKPGYEDRKAELEAKLTEKH